jgi:hypothetical protein
VKNPALTRDPYQITLDAPLCPRQVASLLEAAFMEGRATARRYAPPSGMLFPREQPDGQDGEAYRSSATAVLATRLGRRP